MGKSWPQWWCEACGKPHVDGSKLIFTDSEDCYCKPCFPVKQKEGQSDG